MSAPRLIDIESLPGRLALSPAEAAKAIGCSRTFFDDHVGPHLRMARIGRRKFVPVSELARWMDEQAETAAYPRERRSW